LRYGGWASRSTGSVDYELGITTLPARTNTEPGANRGPRAGSPRGVMVATGRSQNKYSSVFCNSIRNFNHHPVATAPDSVFVNRRFRNSAWLVQNWISALPRFRWL